MANTIDVDVTLNPSTVSSEFQFNTKEIELTISGYRGIQGEQGPQGPEGPPGNDDGLAIAYAVALG